jgi:hypothetical protein
MKSDDELRAQWERCRKPPKPGKYHEWIKQRTPVFKLYPLHHDATGPELILELLHLYVKYHDDRFACAIDAILDLRLVDQRGNWRRRSEGSDCQRDHLRRMSATLAQGVTLRAAARKVAADAVVSANSFDAAVKKLERLWRSAVVKQEAQPPATDDAVQFVNRFSRLIEKLPSDFVNAHVYGKDRVFSGKDNSRAAKVP